MKEIIDSYNQMSSSSEKLLNERTPDEIAHDNIVIKELRKGRSIKKALKIAGSAQNERSKSQVLYVKIRARRTRLWLSPEGILSQNSETEPSVSDLDLRTRFSMLE